MFIVLKDVHGQLDKPEIISLLKYISECNLYNEAYNGSNFILSSKLKIPEELEDFVTVFDMPLPTVHEIVDIMKEFKDDLQGIMIVGMPGCGKSLAAKATAKLFEIPLVRLDVGRLLGKYIGESEENMRKALLLSEAIKKTVSV